MNNILLATTLATLLTSTICTYAGKDGFDQDGDLGDKWDVLSGRPTIQQGRFQKIDAGPALTIWKPDRTINASSGRGFKLGSDFLLGTSADTLWSGVVFNLQDSKNYYSVRINGEGAVQFFRVVDGTEGVGLKHINEAFQVDPTTEWVRIEVTSEEAGWFGVRILRADDGAELWAGDFHDPNKSYTDGSGGILLNQGSALVVKCDNFEILYTAPLPVDDFLKWIDIHTLGSKSEDGELGGSPVASIMFVEKLPFSFEYGGKSSDELLQSFERQLSVNDVSAGKERVVTWQQPGGGLVVKWTVLLFKDRPACEINLVFEYHSSSAAEILRNVKVIRHEVESVLPVEVIGANGGTSKRQDDGMSLDFQPINKALSKPGDNFTLGVSGGRSSEGNLPIWLIMEPGGDGFYYALGWSGQWKTELSVVRSNRLLIQSGMEYLNLRLRDGERIRQPSVLIGSFSGGRWAGHNALRGTLYQEFTALLDGKKPLPPVSWNHWFTFQNAIDEKKVLDLVESVKDLGIEYFCIDAGWFNVDFPDVGDWRHNPEKFPGGLEPVAEAIKVEGMNVGLWFEPERVTQAAYEAFEEKKWLLPADKRAATIKDEDVVRWLVDLSIPAAQQWAVELITSHVKKLGLRWIRFDLNYPPLEMWRNAHENEPDRLGMKEIGYIEGLYKVMDEIALKFPDLVIESTAGGGRRIDLETIRRSQTFWKSDTTGDANVTRSHITGGNQFLPGNYLNTNLREVDHEYDYFCQFGGALGFGHDFRKDSPQKKEMAKNMISLYKSIRHLNTADYYPLFNDFPLDQKQWDGWQFHDPKTGEGYVVVLRPPESPYPEAVIKLHGIDPDKSYQITECEFNDLPSELGGKELGGGLLVRIKEARSAFFAHYKQQ